MNTRPAHTPQKLTGSPSVEGGRALGKQRYFTQRPERQTPEVQKLRSWEPRHPKADVPAPDALVAPEAIGTSHVPTAAERAAPPHAGLIIGRMQCLAPCPLFGIAGVGVLAAQTPRP